MPKRASADPLESCVIGVDVGAGSLKACVVDADGRQRGIASRSYPTHTPQPGWSEQNPDDWWLAACDAIPRALAAAGAAPRAIRALSFSGGAHTAVLLDSANETLRPAILWSDQRSSAEASRLQREHEVEILRTTLNRPTPTWTLPQLIWLRHHEPRVIAETRRLMVAKDWLRFRVSGDWHTDPTDALGTLLWDQPAGAWSTALCELTGLAPSVLPPIASPSGVVGKVTGAAAAACGLLPGTPVVCGTSDTSAEAYGAGADVSGPGIVKLATAATVSIVDDRPHVHSSLINYPFAIPGLWYTISATNSCASAHRWLRDQFFMRPGEMGDAVFEEMDRLARLRPVGSGGLLFHPYLLGERAPYWDPQLRGDFVGITMRHDRGHFARALYEGIAFSLRDVLDQFRERGLPLREARIIGGGARSALWRQIVADVLQVPVVLPERCDASFGAALLAGVGVQLFADERSAVCLNSGDGIVHEPNPVDSARYQDLFGLYKDAQRLLVSLNHRLGEFEGSA